MNTVKYLGMDVGGTKIEVCEFDENFELVQNKKYKTADYTIKNFALIDDLKKIIKDNLSNYIQKIGVSFNCVVNHGVITHSSLLGGTVNYQLEKEWEKEFNRPIHLENDVNAMAIAESKVGQGRNKHSFVLLNLGTGIRPSLVVDGELKTGFSGNMGEVSQKEIPVPELNNKIFKIDDLVSGQGLTNIFRELTGESLMAEEIFKMLNKNATAKKTVDIFINHFISFLKDLSYFYNPEIIILNGSLKKSADLFLPQAMEKYKRETMPFFHFEKIVISQIDHGACLGVVL